MMQFEFLKNFTRRMKTVGRYALLFSNSSQKTTWKQYGFTAFDEQVNMIFAILLFIMEQSLKEENCTMDDIGTYIDTVNMQHFHKELGYDDCRSLGDFVVNVILSNEGKVMHFQGYSFEKNEYEEIHVSYVANRIVYVDSEIRRTSYYLTDDGYNLMLGTLEVENNMKLTIQEMIFRMHMERQSYDKAVDDIKQIFNLLRIQFQKIHEAMSRIRKNALDYSVEDYETILLENLETVSDTKKKFQGYRDLVRKRVEDYEEQSISMDNLSGEEAEKLNNLRQIEQYLGRALDEHQKILNSHFDLKALYTRELEQLTQMSMIRRFSIRSDFYDKLLAAPEALERADIFLRPLLARSPDKVYNPGKAFQLQRPSRQRGEEDSEELLDFDEELWEIEQERKRKEKLARYENCLSLLLQYAVEGGSITLKRMKEICEEEPDKKKQLIPSVEIFKEVMVELLRNPSIEIEELLKEKDEFIQDASEDFSVNEMLVGLVQEKESFSRVTAVSTEALRDREPVLFEDVVDSKGVRKNVRCTDVRILVRLQVERGQIF